MTATPGRDRQRARRARMYAAGYHYVKGVLTEGPRTGPRPVPEHGTAARYKSKSHPCRCDLCRAAGTADHNAWRARQRARQQQQ